MTQEEYINKLLKGGKTIEINNQLISKLGYEDIRDFTEALYYWGHNTDFTYKSVQTVNWQSYLRAFIKSFND